jgi:predicted permease
MLAARCAALFRRKRLEANLDEELQAHLGMLIDENLRRGMAPQEARYAALRSFGGVEQARETYREQRGLPMIETLVQDLRYGLRQLRSNPGFTIVAVLTLALGIGANTAIFSLVDAFLLRNLPVKDPQQLVLVNRVTPKGQMESDFPYPAFEQFRDRNHSFSGIFAWDDSTMSVTVDGQAEFLSGDFVSGSYFRVLGVGAEAGRTFTPDDDRTGGAPAAVISHNYWKRRFSLDPAVIGKPIYLGGTPFTVVGVTSPTFFGRNVAGRSADVTLPMFVHPRLALKDHDTFEIMARLRPGVTPEQARADLQVIYQQTLTDAAGSRLFPELEQQIRAQKIELKPGSRGVGQPSDHFAAEMRILMWVVGITLLIACVNVANLLLARAAGRRKEVALRLALGASRGRLIRQLLSESALLAILGGSLGFLFARWGVSALVAVLSLGGEAIPFTLKPDPVILGFTAGVSLLTGVLFGLAPALTGSRVEVNPALKGTEGATESRSWRGGLGKPLVAAQVALSLVLLVGAGLLIRTLRAAYSIDNGFERDRVLFAWVYPALNGYDHAREMRLYRELLEKMNSVPGIQWATLSRYRPFVARPEKNVWVQSSEIAEPREVYYDPVAPRFFRAMQIGQLQGRDFSSVDTETAPKVAVISESMARTFFPNQNPIGRRLGFDGPQSAGDMQIVGVVRDTRHHLLENGSLDAVYIPYTQAAPDDYGQMNLVFRSAVDPAGVIAALRHQARSVDKDQPLSGIETPAADLDEYLGDHRWLAALLGFFGALALVLASIGLYGTMSYAVGKRTRELGIRMALGAQRNDMLRMILRETFYLVATGIAVGIPLAIASKRLVASMIFGVTVTDPVAISIAVLVMLATGFLAGYVPARRATKVDPMVALRYE